MIATEEVKDDVSQRDSIEAAISHLEGQDNGDTTGAGNATVPNAQEPANLYGSGKAPEPQAKPEGQPAAQPGKEPQPGKDAKPATSLTDTPARAAAKGPASWKPDVREKFAALPPEVQQEVLRRERETQAVLQESAQSRQLVDRMQQTIAPYQQLIALEGGDPMKSFQDYLHTATVLRMGTPVEKANAVAGAIRTFGIDIEHLDAALAAAFQGRPLPVSQHQGPMQDPRVDQLLAMMQDREARSQQAQEAELAAEIETFAAKPEFEFFDDLRGDIGMILAAAVQQNRVMSLAEAYKYAAQLHPEISKVVAQRATANRVKTDSPFIAAKRAAASSVRGQAPAQSGTANSGDLSMRQAIEAAIEAHQM